MNWNKISNYPIKGGYKKGSIEKGFEAELFKFLRKDGYIVFHPQDIGYSSKFLDCFLVDPDGNMGWLELKKIKGDTFNISQFEESQIILLTELYKRNPNIAMVGIYSIKRNSYVLVDFDFIQKNKNKKGGIKLFINN